MSNSREIDKENVVLRAVEVFFFPVVMEKKMYAIYKKIDVTRDNCNK